MDLLEYYVMEKSLEIDSFPDHIVKVYTIKYRSTDMTGEIRQTNKNHLYMTDDHTNTQRKMKEHVKLIIPVSLLIIKLYISSTTFGMYSIN